jgi:hypothetical protein
MIPTVIIGFSALCNLPDSRAFTSGLKQFIYRSGPSWLPDHAKIMQSRLDAYGCTQISAELPLIYATGRRTAPLQVHFPTESENSKAKRSRTSKLEPEPFLRSLPVYRYNPPI